MPYCTLQNLIDRFGEEELVRLTDKRRLGSMDETKINRAIDDVDGLIDSHLSGRSDLPFAEVTKVLNRYACQLVRYDLYDNPTEPVKDRKEEAMKFLIAIRDKKLSLGVNDDGSEPVTDDIAIIQTGGDVFNRKDNGFI